MTCTVLRTAIVVLLGLVPLQEAMAAIEAIDGWSRQTVAVDVAVGYLTLKNTGGSRRELLKITSPIASGILLQQFSIDAQGVSHLWPVGKLEIAPGEVLRFSPTGKRLMLLGLKQPLRAGTLVPVTLVFEDEEPVTIQLLVRPQGD